MNKGAGLAAVFAIALAATRLIPSSSAPAPELVVSSAAKAIPAAKTSPEKPALDKDYGGCKAFNAHPKSKDELTPRRDEYGSIRDRLSGFLHLGEHDDPLGALQQLSTVHYAIVLAPDPTHTQLSMMFDRQMEAMQQAAQDEGYIYDSSWLPWSEGSQTFSHLSDVQIEDRLQGHRDSCPGLLLFRRSPESVLENPNSGYQSGLIILVVGEQPTAGINQDQWDNAIQFLTAVTPAKGPLHALRVLGPTFSGSVASLARSIGELKTTAFSGAQVLSGTMSDCASVRWAAHLLKYAAVRTQFGTFQESDELHIARFLRLLAAQHTNAGETAILSEDETAYGAHPNSIGQHDANNSCSANYDAINRPLRLFYPRDMSALRLEYQKEGLFNQPEGHQVHSILHGDTEPESPQSASDTIRTFSHTITPLAQEAQLYGVVSNLRTHHIRFLLLRCTNPLDFLFLTRFFHRVYPEGRVVIVGQDMLFRREVDTTEFRGVLSLSNYPLLPRDQHWTSLFDNNSTHAHLVFESQLTQGSYIAARYTFGHDLPLEPDTGPDLPLVFAHKSLLSGYTDPFWLHKPGDAADTLPDHPPTWVSVVGRDGFWPLAVLNQNTVDSLPPSDKYHPLPATPESIMVRLTNARLHFDITEPPSPDPGFSKTLLFTLPTPWTITVLLVIVLITYQMLGLKRFRQCPPSGLFSPFQPSVSLRQNSLIVLSSILALSALLAAASMCFIPSPTVLTPSWIRGLMISVIVIALIFVGWHLLQRSLTIFCCIFLPMAAMVLDGSFYLLFFVKTNLATEMPLFYRMGHVNSGVSPLLPMLLLVLGGYLACWQAMAGNLLFGEGSPRLPVLPDAFVRISSVAEARIQKIAKPFSIDDAVIMPPILLCGFMTVVYWHNFPLLSLEGHLYTGLINLALLLGFMIIVAEGSRLFLTWIELRRLLAALNRLRLRRTFNHLRAIPSTSLWSVAGNVQRIQYQFFAAQFDALRRLNTIYAKKRKAEAKVPSYLADAFAYAYTFALQNAGKFENGPTWSEPVPAKDTDLSIRNVMATATGSMLEEILRPEWKKETNSLNMESDSVKPGEVDREIALSDNLTVATAEEFVCLHYVSYIQNVLARMRTMVLSMIFLFVAICLSISFYPFIPRTQVTIWMMIGLAFIGTVVIYVYAGMERDETLSNITNTPAGQLGSEFWIKTASFLAGPVFGILATQFPSISDSILGWLQPGLDSFK